MATQQRFLHELANTNTIFEMVYISQAVKGVTISSTEIKAEREFRVYFDLANRTVNVYGRTKRFKTMPGGERLELFTRKGELSWRRGGGSRASRCAATTASGEIPPKILLENGLDRERFSEPTRSYKLPSDCRITLKYLNLADRCSVKRILHKHAPSFTVELQGRSRLLCLPDSAEKVTCKMRGESVCDGRITDPTNSSSRHFSSTVLVFEAFLYNSATIKNISVTTQLAIRSFSPDVKVRRLQALDHCKLTTSASSESFLENIRIERVQALPPPSSVTTTTTTTVTSTRSGGGGSGSSSYPFPLYAVRSPIAIELLQSINYTLSEREAMHIAQDISASEASSSSSQYLHSDKAASVQAPPTKRLCGKLAHRDVEATEEQDKCAICLTNLPVVVVFPCGDVAYCFECAGEASKLKRCALCREEQQAVVMPKKTHSVVASSAAVEAAVEAAEEEGELKRKTTSSSSSSSSTC